MAEKLPQIAVGLLLAGFVLFAFWLYFQYLRRKNDVNFGTWFILAYGDILDLGSYFSMTGKWWLNLVPGAFAIGSISIFFYALGKQCFGQIRWVDRFCVVADMSITVLWGYLLLSGQSIVVILDGWFGRTLDPGTTANLAYQATAIIAFIPMWVSQMAGRELEDPVPWLIWASVFLAFGVMMAYEYDKPEELVYPYVNLYTHFMIGATALVAATRLRLGVALR